MRPVAFWKQLLIVLALAALGAVAWVNRDAIPGLAEASEAAGPQRGGREGGAGVPVLVSPVRTLSDDLTFSAVGTGLAAKSVTLRAESGGQVTEVRLVAGQRYAEGDVLLKLEESDARFALDLAEARFENAESSRERFQLLRESGATAAARFEEAETQFRVAEIELRQAREALADRVVRAPFDGVSGFPEVEVGDWITPADPIASFDDRSEILVEFDLPEALLARLSLGLAVTATTPAVPGRTFEGEVTGIGSRVDAESRTAKVRVSVENEGDLLRPGASFAVRLDLPGKSYPAVPELALQFSRGSLNVWVVHEGEARTVDIRMVRRRAGEVIVEGPISDGDLVVVEGTQRLRPGIAVEVLNAEDGV